MRSEHFKKAVSRNGKPCGCPLLCGESYIKLGNRKKAIEAYRKTLETDPNHLSARAKLDRLVVSSNESP